MTLEGERVADTPIKDGILEAYNTDSQCDLETEPEKNKRKKSRKTEDSSIGTHLDTSSSKDDLTGTNSCHGSSFPVLSRNQRRRMRKKQRLNSARVDDEVQASLPDSDSTGKTENSLISEKQSYYSESASASIVNKYNGDFRLREKSSRVTSNSDEMHSTKIANNEMEGVVNVSIEKHSLYQHDKKLLILDVNGLLADIVSQTDRKYKHDIIVSRKYVFKRPFCDSFLQFCFEKFNVGVWSSRIKANLDSIVNFLMPDYRHKLLFCWDQSHCTNTGFRTPTNIWKPLFLKELRKVWDKLEPGLPWNKGEFNETNTVLIDDSPYKALTNPANTAIFPHSYDHKNAGDCSLGPDGDLYAYLEKLAEAPNVQEFVALNPFGQKAITELNDFHQKVLRSVFRDESSVIIPPPPLPLPLPPQFQQSGFFPRSGFWDQMLRPCSTGNFQVCDFQHQYYPRAPESRQSLLHSKELYDPFVDCFEQSSNSFKKFDWQF